MLREAQTKLQYKRVRWMSQSMIVHVWMLLRCTSQWTFRPLRVDVRDPRTPKNHLVQISFLKGCQTFSNVELEECIRSKVLEAPELQQPRSILLTHVSSDPRNATTRPENLGMHITTSTLVFSFEVSKRLPRSS